MEGLAELPTWNTARASRPGRHEARQGRRGTARAATIVLATAAAASVTAALNAGSASAAVPGGFSPVGVSAQVGYLNSVACPNTAECFAAGQTAGADQRGLVLRLLDGSWRPAVISAVSYLNSISCTDDRHCVAAGVSSDPAHPGAGIVVATNDGTTWHVPVQPSPAAGAPVPLDSVSCAGTFCMATGVRVSSTSPTTSVVWVTTGGAWTATNVPRQPATSSTYLVAVACPAARDCWAVGGAAWHTADAGRSWQLRSPPDSSGLSAPWSLLYAAYFADPLHGLVAGGDQCGGATDHCPGAIFSTSNGGASWREVSGGSVPFVEAMTCRSPGLVGCLAASAIFTPIRPGGATSNVTDGSVISMSSTSGGWRVVQHLNGDNVTSIACPAATKCVAVGGDQAHNTGAIFTDHPTAAPAQLSVVATALPTPAQAFQGEARTITNAAITAAAILALTFPAQLFNNTFEENYDEILGIGERRLRWLSRARARSAAKRSPRRDAVTFVAVLVSGSLIGSLRDPAFGANTASVLSFTATVLAIATMALAGYAVGRAYRALIHARTQWSLHTLPGGIAVAAGCVAVSRIADFRPGYLYGVICGVAFSGVLRRREQGQLTTAASVTTLAVAAAAWLAWVPVNHAALRHGVSIGVILLDDVLASIFVGGLTGTVISLLPLRFMPGQLLYTWHRVAWAATFGIATFAITEILLRPAAGTDHAGNVAWLTASVLFVFFGGGSLAFREYFARRVPAEQRQLNLGATIITHLRQHDGSSQDDLATALDAPARHLHATLDRLERSHWIHRDRAPGATDTQAPLHLSPQAHALHEQRNISWIRQQRLTLALTRAERAALAHILNRQPAARADSTTPGDKSAVSG